MCNIFNDIENYIFAENSYFIFYEEYASVIKNFLRNRGDQDARELFDYIKKVQQKENVYENLDRLNLYEHSFREVLPEQRDHYIHSATVYVLGIAIINASPTFRKVFSKYYKDKYNAQNIQNTFLFEWSMAACLHDIAYPFEMSLKVFNKLTSSLYKETGNEKVNTISIKKDIYEKFNILPIIKRCRPNDKYKDTAIGLIVDRITSINNCLSYETLLKYVEDKLSNDLQNGKLDHGVFSSLILLNQVHKLYEENTTWIAKYFYNEVVNSATAIFLHNFYRFSELKRFYGNNRFPLKELNPLAYLLFFCDSLSEWNRWLINDYDNFSLMINDSTITMRVNGKAFDEISKIKDMFAPDINFILEL